MERMKKYYTIVTFLILIFQTVGLKSQNTSNNLIDTLEAVLFRDTLSLEYGSKFEHCNPDYFDDEERWADSLKILKYTPEYSKVSNVLTDIISTGNADLKDELFDINQKLVGLFKKYHYTYFKRRRGLRCSKSIKYYQLIVVVESTIHKLSLLENIDSDKIYQAYKAERDFRVSLLDPKSKSDYKFRTYSDITKEFGYLREVGTGLFLFNPLAPFMEDQLIKDLDETLKCKPKLISRRLSSSQYLYMKIKNEQKVDSILFSYINEDPCNKEFSGYIMKNYLTLRGEKYLEKIVNDLLDCWENSDKRSRDLRYPFQGFYINRLVKRGIGVDISNHKSVVQDILMRRILEDINERTFSQLYFYLLPEFVNDKMVSTLIKVYDSDLTEQSKALVEEAIKRDYSSYNFSSRKTRKRVAKILKRTARSK